MHLDLNNLHETEVELIGTALRLYAEVCREDGDRREGLQADRLHDRIARRLRDARFSAPRED